MWYGLRRWVGKRTDTESNGARRGKELGAGSVSRVIVPCWVQHEVAYQGKDDEEIIPSRCPLDDEPGIQPQ
jgi:hypothetical protein